MMFSKCFQMFEMTIPIQWKEANVVAIYKKGDKKWQATIDRSVYLQ